jgi:hypothetical protein
MNYLRVPQFIFMFIILLAVSFQDKKKESLYRFLLLLAFFAIHSVHTLYFL